MIERFLNTTAAVLAGGKSKRFGRRKEQVLYQNRTLLEHAINLAEQIGEEILVISDVRDFKLPPHISRFPDLIPDCGPLGGIYTAMHYASQKCLAVIPCDMPLLKVDIYRLLFSAYQGNEPVVAVSQNGVEPLVSIWPVSVKSVLRKHIQKQNLSLRDILTQLHRRLVSIAPVLNASHPACFVNVNYQQDLERLMKNDVSDWP